MAKVKNYTSDYPDNAPEWYWVNGLHDACIKDADMLEFPFDYKKFISENNRYTRNILTLKINAGNALYDRRVKEIRFFNYKILSDDISLDGRKEIWWMADRLTDHGDYYTLEIDLQDFSSYPEDFTIKIKFERAEVDRS